MNLIFVNKYLPFREQDTKKAVLPLFFTLLLVTAVLPHAHLLAAIWTVAFFASGVLRSVGAFREDLLFSLFLVLTLSGAVLSDARESSFLSFLLRLSFFIPLLFEDKKDEMRRMISLLGGVVGALALFELILGGGTARYNDPGLFSTLVRAEGLFDNPNTTAAFLLPSALFSLYRLLYGGGWRSFFPLLGAILGIAATFSRGALLALLTASFVLLAHRFGFLPVLFTALALSPAVLLLLPDAMVARLSSILSPDTSVLYRFSLWRSIFRLPVRSLSFGVGEGKKAMLSALSPHLAAGLLKLEHTHSLFLHILLAEGMIGLFVFFVLLGRALCKKGAARYALLSLLLFGIFDDPLYCGQTEVLFWLTLGLC